MNQINIIPCPPLSDYKKQPADQSKCTAEECPKCHQKMWLSEKKKAIMLFAKETDKQLLVACYHCIMKIAEENPEIISKSPIVTI
jgi:hypothetical protein